MASGTITRYLRFENLVHVGFLDRGADALYSRCGRILIVSEGEGLKKPKEAVMTCLVCLSRI